MKAVKIGDDICLYTDAVLPECYSEVAVSFDVMPVKPEGKCKLDIVDGALVWVIIVPEPIEPEEPTTDPTVWDELDAAYQEGVDSI